MYICKDCGDEFSNFWDEIDYGYDIAESLMKKLEYEEETLWAPAINQLRYAGRHIITLHQLDSCEDRKYELKEVYTHVRRAINDIADAFILFQIEKFENFDADYKEFPITDELVKYPEIKAEIKAIRDELTEEGNFGKYYVGTDGLKALATEKKEKALKIKKLVNILDASRPGINKRIIRERKRDQRIILGTIISFLLLVVSIITLIKLLSS